MPSFYLDWKDFYDLQIGLATERLSNKNPISERVIANNKYANDALHEDALYT